MSLLSLLALSIGVAALNTGVGKLPAMGYNTWNRYGCSISDSIVQSNAKAMVSLGLQAAGYNYVNLDDCWLTKSRSSTGTLVPDPAKFPNGLASLASTLHGMGFKMGIYEDSGTSTCAGYPGSLGHETTDANTFASWGIDYLKFDNCNSGSTPDQTRYNTMRDALAAAGKTYGYTLFYSLCSWGNANVWTWANGTGQSWRISGDISASYSSVLSILNTAAPIVSYSNFWGHNDLDMLEIGNGMSQDEEKTHFSAWALLKSPLLIGTDLTKISSSSLNILLNTEIIAINQDPVIGAPVQPFGPTGSPPLYYGGAISVGGANAVVMILNTGSSTSTMSFTFSQVPGIPSSSSGYYLRDLWARADIGCVTSSTYSTSIPSHGVAVFSIRSCSGGGGSTTSHTATTTTHTTTTSPVGACAAEWAQCGGIGYSGSTTCCSSWTCTYSNPYYSQCL